MLLKPNKIQWGLIALLLFACLPVIVGLLYAFANSIGVFGIASQGFTGKYWWAVWKDGVMLVSLCYSFYIAIVSMLLSVSIALLLIVAKQDKWLVKTPRFAVSSLLVFPALVMGFLVVLWLGKSGIVSRMAFHLNMIASVQQFPDLIFDRYGIGIIVAHVCMATPFFVLYFANIYKQQHLHQYQLLAASLGASKRYYHQKIFLPILWRYSLPSIVLYTVFVMGAYEIPLLCGRSYPQMITILTTQKLSKFNLEDKPQAYAIAIVYTIVVMLIINFVFQFKKAHQHD